MLCFVARIRSDAKRSVAPQINNNMQSAHTTQRKYNAKPERIMIVMSRRNHKYLPQKYTTQISKQQAFVQ